MTRSWMRTLNSVGGNGTDRVRRLNSLVVRTDANRGLASSCSLYGIIVRFVINRVYWRLIAGTANPYSTYHRYDVCMYRAGSSRMAVNPQQDPVNGTARNQGYMLFHEHQTDHYSPSWSSYSWIFKMQQFSAISCGILTCFAASLVFTYVRFHFCCCFKRKHLKATWLR